MRSRSWSELTALTHGLKSLPTSTFRPATEPSPVTKPQRLARSGRELRYSKSTLQVTRCCTKTMALKPDPSRPPSSSRFSASTRASRFTCGGCGG